MSGLEMQNLRKKLNNYKYTIISFTIASFILGADAGIFAGIFGFIVDYLINRKTVEKKNNNNALQKSLNLWAGIVGPFTMVYTTIIMLFTGPDTTSGIIYSWIDFTAPFASKMAHYLPAIENYTNQLSLRVGESWRIPRITHLCAVMWFVNIILSFILVPRLIWGAKKAPETLSKHITSKEGRISYKLFVKHYLKLFLGLVFVTIAIAICIKISAYGLEIGTGSYSRKMELVIALSPFLTVFFIFPLFAVLIGLVLMKLRLISELLSKFSIGAK